MGLSFVGNPNPRHAYKKCVLSLPKDHSWPILVAHATMSIYISNIYDSIYPKVYIHKNHPKVGMKVIIVAP
jgi:hypothetical protein